MSERTGIDDLLSFEEEAPPPTRRDGGGRGRWVVRFLASAAALTAVVLVCLRAVGLQVSVWIVVAEPLPGFRVMSRPCFL